MTATGSHAPAGGRWRRRLRIASVLLSAAAFVWVVATLLARLSDVRAAAAGSALLVAIAAGAVAYTALTGLLAAAWWWLLGAYRERPGLVPAAVVWARAQIAKYLPGNVFHYARRQLLGRLLGLSHASLIASAVLETGSTVAAAVAITLAAAAGPALGRAGLPSWPVLLAVAAGLLLVWPAVDRGLRAWSVTAGSMRDLPVLTAGRTVALLLPGLVLHTAFLLGTGLVLLGLLRAGWPDAAAPIVPVVGSYALAWLAGTLMPGAPGGLGVREAVLVVLLGPTLGPAHASALALALRAVTLAGDLLAGLIGTIAPLRDVTSA